MIYHGVTFLFNFGLSLKRSCLIKAMDGVPSPKREYNSLVIPVALLMAASVAVFCFFFLGAGAVLGRDRTSRISALVIRVGW